MAEEDNFDLDIYGDGGYNGQEGPELILDAPETNGHEGGEGQHGNNDNTQTANGQDTQHPIQSTAGQAPQQHTPVQQGQKRKTSSSEDRPTDPDATTALFISELFWWTTDDDIRGWVNEANAEDELKDVTFSEHKVNGKSKRCVSVNECAILLQEKRLTQVQSSIRRIHHITSCNCSQALD